MEINSRVFFREIKTDFTVAVTAFVMIFIVALISVTFSGAIVSVLTAAMLSVLAAVFAAELIIMTTIYRRHHGVGKLRRNLRKILDLHEGPWEDKIAIVIPRLKELSDDRSNENVLIKDNVVKSSLLANGDIIARDDIIAMRHISKLFTTLGVQSPRLEFDDDIYNAYFSSSPDPSKLEYDYRVLICIGLYSNWVTMHTHDKSELFRVAVDGIENFHDKEKFIRKAALLPNSDEMGDLNTKTWNLIADSDARIRWRGFTTPEEDFGLIIKHQFVNKTVLAFAGGDSRSTRKAASYFKNNWNKNNGDIARAGPFAFLGVVANPKGSKFKVLNFRQI